MDFYYGKQPVDVQTEVSMCIFEHVQLNRLVCHTVLKAALVRWKYADLVLATFKPAQK